MSVNKLHSTCRRYHRALGQTNVLLRRVGVEKSKREGTFPSKFNRGWKTRRRTCCTSACYLLLLLLLLRLSILNILYIPNIRLRRPKVREPPGPRQGSDMSRMSPTLCNNMPSYPIQMSEILPLASLLSHVPYHVIVKSYTFESQKSVIIITIYPRLPPRPICATLLNTQIPDPEPNVGCRRVG